MQSSQLNRILNLVRRTGDKFVILDQESDEAFTLMPLSDYEHLLDGASSVSDLSEEEIWEKVDRDLNEWRSNHPVDNDWESEKENNLEQNLETDEVSSEDDLSTSKDFEIEPEEIEEEIKDIPTILSEPEIIPLQTPEAPTSDNLAKEEDLSDVPEDEEEKFYLEPVE